MHGILDLPKVVLFIDLIRKPAPFWQCEVYNSHMAIRLSSHIILNLGPLYIKLFSLGVEKYKKHLFHKEGLYLEKEPEEMFPFTEEEK